MAATQTVDHRALARNSINLDVLPVSRHGVVTLFGYGIDIRVDRGHLIIQDGVGRDRRQARLPRVGHGLQRLVVIGSDGTVSLAALRWLADQNAAFVMLDRDGSVLAVTGPVRPSDVRLRRAQACADQSGVALQASRELIRLKLSEQARVARDKLGDRATAKLILEFKTAVDTASTISAVRLLEAQAAAAYWLAWRSLPIIFPRNDLRRVPDHWRVFGTRTSLLTGSPRRAANPVNAMLNYLYALLESESRLAAAALGLDPGMGVLHVDERARDSLACDLMEPVRPLVDAFVLDWFTRTPLKREWFFEKRDGTCRLMGSFAVQLSETLHIWRGAVAPLAEWIAQTFRLSMPRSDHPQAPTPLTQARRRAAHGKRYAPPPAPARPSMSICHVCGTPVTPGTDYCVLCSIPVITEHLDNVRPSGWTATQTAKAQARRSKTQRRQNAAIRGWIASNQPAWLDNETYTKEIQPRLAQVTRSTIANALGVSSPYAADIRAGRRRPHPRHWEKLAELVGVTGKG